MNKAEFAPEGPEPTDRYPAPCPPRVQLNAHIKWRAGDRSTRSTWQIVRDFLCLPKACVQSLPCLTDDGPTGGVITAIRLTPAVARI